MTQVSFKMNAIDRNGPVALLINFEPGIAGDREVTELKAMLFEEIDRDLTSHGPFSAV